MGKKKPSQAASEAPAGSRQPQSTQLSLKAPAGIKKPAAKADKPASKKPAVNEIDDIFTSGKEKKAAKESLVVAEAAAGSTQQGKEIIKGAKPAKVEGSKDDLFGVEVGKGRKKTEEGWNVYTEDELGLGKGGGGDTELCPFDCQCCF